MKTQHSTGDNGMQGSHSRSEAGHIKNLANFQELISTCLSYGNGYNPANSTIGTMALQALHNSADAAINNCVNGANALQQAINVRALAFAKLKITGTRIMAALIACGADAETIKNARTYNRKIQGNRAEGDSGRESENAGEAPVRHISVSQQSHDRFIYNLKALINYVSQLGVYHPNEADLQVPQLSLYANSLQHANSQVITARVVYNNALAVRNRLLYDIHTGLVHIAYEVKKYIISVYGAGSAQARRINHIAFKKLLRGVRKRHKKP